MGRTGVVRLHALLVLFLVFVNFWLKKKKRKKRKLLALVKVFSLANEVFFDFRESFYAKFVPKITIRESFCQKFRDFLISGKFLPLKYNNNNRDDKTYDKLINVRIITVASLKMTNNKLGNVNYIGNKKHNSNDKKF